MSLLSCSGKRPTDLGVSNFKLRPCPETPNCVSSDADADDEKHRITAFHLNTAPDIAWQAAREAILNQPRTQIISETTDYLHAECESAIFGFIDDLELNLRPSSMSIAVRSASRLGSSDFGVNRKRIEEIRHSLLDQKIIE